MIKKIVFFSIFVLANIHTTSTYHPLQRNNGVTTCISHETDSDQEPEYDELDRLADQLPEQHHEEPTILTYITKRCLGYFLLHYIAIQQYCKKNWHTLLKLIS